MADFLNVYNLKNLVYQKTCFKNPDNPTCIDLILTNSPRSFQNTNVFETGLSDFHKLATTVLKIHFPKKNPNIVVHRDFKKFRNDLFRLELDNELIKHDINNIEYDHFINIFTETLSKHAPSKKKYVRANQSGFMTKDLNKAIMKRSKLRNTFLKEKSDSARKAYASQRNICVNLLRKTKKNYFANLDVNSITDNRKFWQTAKPLFSNKLPHKETINLSENGKILNNDNEIAITFNNYFSNIIKKLSLPSAKSYNEENIDNITNPTYLAIEKYKNHPSILTIKNKMQSLGHPSFSFQYVSHDQVLKEVNKLNPRKASQDSDIPVKVIRENIDIVAYFIYNNFNNSLSSFIFPTELKYADIKPVFKKDDKTNKENYRPISIPPNLSKIYERLMYDQLYPYFNKIFSKFQCGFRKGFNSQQCLLSKNDDVP